MLSGMRKSSKSIWRSILKLIGICPFTLLETTADGKTSGIALVISCRAFSRCAYSHCVFGYAGVFDSERNIAVFIFASPSTACGFINIVLTNLVGPRKHVFHRIITNAARIRQCLARVQEKASPHEQSHGGPRYKNSNHFE